MWSIGCNCDLGCCDRWLPNAFAIGITATVARRLKGKNMHGITVFAPLLVLNLTWKAMANNVCMCSEGSRAHVVCDICLICLGKVSEGGDRGPEWVWF